MNNLTFTIIKPDAVKSKYTGKIINDIIEGGFEIKAMKLIKMSKKIAEKFYEIHKERPFYKDLVNFMSSSKVVVAVLEKENAVEEFRKLIGSTNPENAALGTIRKKYAKNIEMNAIHGSDSDENAKNEIDFFFTSLELI